MRCYKTTPFYLSSSRNNAVQGVTRQERGSLSGMDTSQDPTPPSYKVPQETEKEWVDNIISRLEDPSQRSRH